MENFVVNIADTFHPYGFHRDKGAYPGEVLRDKLKPILEKAQNHKQPLHIDLNGMKALYGSFVDGAFGLYMDQYKDKFYEVFMFKADKNPEYLGVVNRIYERHKDRQFNVGA